MPAMVLTVAFFIAVIPVVYAYGAGKSPQSPVLEKTVSYNYHKIKLTWQPSAGAEGYHVYRASSENGKFTRIAEIDDLSKTTYIDGNRITGKRYYYKVRAYRTAGGKKYYSAFSETKSAYARPVTVKNLEAEWQVSGYRLTWDAVKGADGYQVAVRQNGDTSWRKGWYYKQGPTYEETIFVGQIVVDGTEAVVFTGNCSYEFKVRAYRIRNGKKVYGKYSEVVVPQPEVTAEGLKEAAEDYIRSKYPGVKFSSDISRTPENSSWGPVWPKSFSRYMSAEEIIEKYLGDALDFYAENFWKVSAGGTPAGSIYVREVDCCLSVWWIA